MRCIDFDLIVLLLAFPVAAVVGNTKGRWEGGEDGGAKSAISCAVASRLHLFSRSALTICSSVGAGISGIPDNIYIFNFQAVRFYDKTVQVRKPFARRYILNFI